MIFLLRLSALLLIALSMLGIFRAQQITWPATEAHFYEIGLNPGYVPEGDDIKPMILGFDNFVADLFWLRAVQYAGGHAGAFEFEALPEYIELVTDLDPHFEFAYVFGALVFPLSDSTIDAVPPLLQKGIERNRDVNPDALPDLYINLGFYTYFYLNEYEEAAAIYEECAEEIAGCPPFAKNVAAFLRAKAGKFEIALQIWLQKLVETAGEGSIQEDEVALRKTEESAKMAAISCAANHYWRENGVYPQDVTDLIGVKTYPCDAFANLPPQYIRFLGELGSDWGLTTISNATLTSPFDHNPFVWDTENNRLKTIFW